MGQILSSILRLTLLVSPALVFAAETEILNDQYIKLNQIDFPDETNAVLNSSLGMLQANLIGLRSASEISSGYINLVIDGNWVVRNMPVLPESQYPYSLLSTQFDLGIDEGTDISSVTATLLYSEDVKQSAPATAAATFPVGSQIISQGGIGLNGSRGARGSTSLPVLNDVLFGDPADTRAIFQLDHPNVEAAANQCYPMAIANSLQFLANTTSLELPHSHVPGLKGDGSLVGQLDLEMQRTVVSRSNGEGVNDIPGLQGKMRYLHAAGLQGQIETRHWGRYSGNESVSLTLNGKTASSTKMGLAVEFDKVISALEAGENCEAAYSYADGNGHAVDIAAAGYTNGQPWMIESSDINQSSDTDGAGPEGFIFSHLVDTNNDGDYNMNGAAQELDLVICQKYVPAKIPTGTFLPPPAADFFIPGVELDILKATDPAGHGCCVNPLPGSVSVAVTGSSFTLDAASGTARPPYFPFVFDVNDGGIFSAESTGTVAGNPNIQNVISGNLTSSNITGEIALGTAGGLPGGQPISWEFEILAPDGGWPWTLQDAAMVTSTAVRVNGFRSDVTISQTEPFSLGIGLSPGASLVEGETFIVVQTGDLIASFDPMAGTWVEGLSPASAGPIVGIGNEPVFTLPEGGLPPGNYTFYFAVDDTVDNSLNTESLIFDSVNVTVE